MSKRLVISADTSGTVAEGYALGDVTVTNPNVLKVSGPASIVSTINSAVATIDVEGMSVNLSDNVVPVLYDENGKEVDTTRLTISNTTVTVSAKILVVKELKLAFSTVGTPGGEYNVVGITSDPTVIAVKGAASVVNPLTTITIPEELLNVSGLREDLTTTIDITEFLPEGVALVDSADAKVAVTVRIEPYKAQSYPISVNQITVLGLEEGHEITFKDATIYATISALQSNLNLLNADEITGTIDVSGLSVGTHQVTVVLDLDNQNYAYQTITVEVTISIVDDPGNGDDAGGDTPSDEEENTNGPDNESGGENE